MCVEIKAALPFACLTNHTLAQLQFGCLPIVQIFQCYSKTKQFTLISLPTFASCHDSDVAT